MTHENKRIPFQPGTAAPTPDAKLIERVARAICWAEHKDGEGLDSPEESWAAWHANYESLAEAAIEACLAEEMREALELLCEAKDLKETYGNGPAYREVKERGWEKARTVLAKLEAP